MAHSLAQAAQVCGVNRSTILRAIKSGKLSATRSEHGEWHIEPAELHRIYPPVAPPRASVDAPHQYAQPDATPDLELHGRAALAEQRLTDMKAMLDDMRAQRDAWQKQAERLALAAPMTTPAPTPAPIPASRPWWKRLAG